MAAVVNNTKFLWYTSRATGIIAMVLLGVVVTLGILTASKSTPLGLGKFIGPDLHRRLSISTLVFLVAHIISAILDPFVTVGIGASLIPFAAKYRPLWVGLGTTSFDLLLVIVATSVVRHRFNHGIWKKVHYLSWVVVTLVLFHALGTGSDAHIKLVEGIYVLFVLAMGGAGIYRAYQEYGLAKGQKIVAGASLFLVPIALLGWALNGPLKAGWAKSASGFSIFPTTTVAVSSGSTAKSSSTSQAASGPAVALPITNAAITGTMTQTQTSSGVVVLVLRGSVANSVDYVEVQLNGVVQEGALALESSTAFLGTKSAPNTYTGTVTQANGSALTLSLKGPKGAVTANLNVSLSGSSFSGTISAS